MKNTHKSLNEKGNPKLKEKWRIDLLCGKISSRKRIKENHSNEKDFPKARNDNQLNSTNNKLLNNLNEIIKSKKLLTLLRIREIETIKELNFMNKKQRYRNSLTNQKE